MDDLKIYQPNELIFMVCDDDSFEDEGIIFVTVTPRKIWETENRHLDEEFEWVGMEDAGFGYASDSTYDFGGTADEARALLKSAGMEERPEMNG